MKTLFIFCFFLVILPITAQQNLTTKTTNLNELITFISEEFPSKEATNTNKTHVTFLIETHQDNLTKNDKNALKQAMLFLNERLTTTDAISISFYNKRNGLLIAKIPGKQTAKLLQDIEKSIIVKPFKDGLSETFNHANSEVKNYQINTLVFIKNPPKELPIVKPTIQLPTKQSIVQAPKSLKTGQVILHTAISLLPELINVIKD